MSKHDLQARPIYHRKRDSIEAHLTIVFAALAVSRWIEVRTARRYRVIEIQAGDHTITAADPCPATSAKPSTASTATQVRTDRKNYPAEMGGRHRTRAWCGGRAWSGAVWVIRSW